MPRLFTMDALVLACQQQVGLENHSVISRAEWQMYISRAYGELWTIVFESGLQYFEYEEEFTTNGTNELEEPDDHLSTISFSYVENGTQYYDLRELAPQERARASRLFANSYARSRFYALVDDKIYLYPTPPTGQTYAMRYVPQSPDLTTFDGDDCADVVTPDGHDFLIWGVAVRTCGKTEADPVLAKREYEDARTRFTESVRLRALTAPRRMQVQTDDDLEEPLW